MMARQQRHSVNRWACRAVCALLGMIGPAQAALIDRGGGLIYDSSRNLTWLADMNHAKTTGHDSDGRMNWSEASAWAANLVYGGYDDWRLPTLDPSDDTCSDSYLYGNLQLRYGYGCQLGELSGLFVSDLGNKKGETVLDPAGDTPEQMANLALFRNVQVGEYWSSAEFGPNPAYSWIFITSHGYQTSGSDAFPRLALAVRDGDVGAAVPEPQSLALVLTSLVALVALGSGLGGRGVRRG